MTNEMKEWLATIEPADTTPTLQRLEAIKKQARREVEMENKERIEKSLK